MQTTLLTIAVAIILAVVAALVAPFFIDWGTYRSVFEREAGRLTGLEIKVDGQIDARLLPSPRLDLQNVAIGSGSAPLRARSLAIEFALSPLMRGEWRAAEMRLVGPQIRLALNGKGEISGPSLAFGFDPDTISVERLGIEDGRIVLDDTANKTSFALEKMWFNGDLRSLLGPLRGEGAFTYAGDLYPYRISTGRLGDGGTVRVRLNIDPTNMPLNVESDGTLTVAGKPQFDGTLGLSRPVGIAPQGGAALLTQPWRLGGKLKVTPASALIQDGEFSYGSEPNAVKLTGTAEFKFGARPRFDGVLSARQIDLDRLAGEGDAAVRSPPAASLRRLAALTGQAFKPSFPVQIGLGIDQVTLGGTEIYGLRGDVSTAPDGWTLDRFEFRAPGSTQVRVSGKLAIGPAGAQFNGPADISASDPQALAAWLEGRQDKARTASPRALRLRGDLTLGSEKFAVERLNAGFERGTVAGSFVYAFATRDRGARVDATLNAPELDLDAASAFAKALVAGSTVEAPTEANVAVEIGRATFAGFDAGKTSARLQYGKSGVRIERLSIDNLGGAAIAASGQIALVPQPRGNVTVDLNARELAGINSLVGRYWPGLAARLRTASASLAPARLRANLKVEDTAPGSRATLSIDGTAGVMRVGMEGQAGVTRLDLGSLPSDTANPRLQVKLDADNAQVLAVLLGIDRYVAVGKDAGSFSVSATGPALGQLQADGKFTGGGLDASANGTIGYNLGGISQAALRATVTRANLAPLRGGSSIPVSLAGRITYAPDRIAADELAGTVAGAAVRGKLALGLGVPRMLSGDIEMDSLDAGALLATAIGMPSGGALWNWPAEPFADTLPSDIKGSVGLRAMRAIVPPSFAARDLRATVRMNPDELTLDDFSASLVGGRLSGSLNLKEAPEGLQARAKLSLTDAEATAFVPSAARPPITGRLTFSADLEGTGRSPQALMGALQGAGKLSLTNAELAGLDPRAFASAIRATDQGMPVEKPRVESLVTSALGVGRLSLREVQSDLTINAGQVRLANTRAKGEGADVAISGGLDLTIGTLDARVVLTGAERVANARPDIFLTLRGPVAAPQREVDVSALTSWLTLRSIEMHSKKLDAIELAPPSIVAPGASKAEAPAPRPEQRPTVQPLPPPQRPAVQPLPPPIDIAPRPSGPPPALVRP